MVISMTMVETNVRAGNGSIEWARKGTTTTVHTDLQRRLHHMQSSSLGLDVNGVQSTKVS
jgi:hypothetical protein